MENEKQFSLFTYVSSTYIIVAMQGGLKNVYIYIDIYYNGENVEPQPNFTKIEKNI